jgi:hypothetical protein
MEGASRSGIHTFVTYISSGTIAPIPSLCFCCVCIVTNTQEDTMHSAAPSKCIHISTRNVHMDMTGAGKKKHHTQIEHNGTPRIHL